MGYDLYAKMAVQKCVHVHILPSHKKNIQNMFSKLYILKLKIFQFE